MSSTISSSTSSPISVCSNKSLERKVRKPKIEKLRRARINTSLEQLKEILLRNTIWKHTQGSRPTKLEKADILEMSVRYIEMLHDKLSTEKSLPAMMSKRNEQVDVKSIHYEAFRDISNQIDERMKSKRQVRGVGDEKSLSSSSLWYYNRFNMHQRKSIASIANSDGDKENFILNTMRQFNENISSSISTSTQQSIFSSSLERHWRPW